jgi:nucleotide-binding universal stress UspA family protein
MKNHLHAMLSPSVRLRTNAVKDLAFSGCDEVEILRRHCGNTLGAKGCIMYEKIIVPLDGSKLAEQVLPFVHRLAEADDIPIELFTVTDPDARPPFWPAEPDESYLKEVSQKYFAASRHIAIAVEIGKPADVIADLAKDDPGCLIAMSTHGMSGMRRWLLGSVASKVVQTATNPLLLIRPVEGVNPSTPVDLKTIFVPLDGSALAEKVLPQVIDLAGSMKLEVHLIRVYTLPVNAFVVTDGVIAQGPAPFRQELRNEAETYLDGKAAQLRAHGVEQIMTSALEGDPASEINDIARNTANNLVAMSTHGRSGISRWVLGSVAEKVVQHSRDPVLLIRAA